MDLFLDRLDVLFVFIDLLANALLSRTMYAVAIFYLLCYTHIIVFLSFLSLNDSFLACIVRGQPYKFTVYS